MTPASDVLASLLSDKVLGEILKEVDDRDFHNPHTRALGFGTLVLRLRLLELLSPWVQERQQQHEEDDRVNHESINTIRGLEAEVARLRQWVGIAQQHLIEHNNDYHHRTPQSVIDIVIGLLGLSHERPTPQQDELRDKAVARVKELEAEVARLRPWEKRSSARWRALTRQLGERALSLDSTPEMRRQGEDVLEDMAEIERAYPAERPTPSPTETK